MPLCCPDNSETLSGCFRNGCPDAAEIRNRKDDRVMSIMIEVNRSLYMNENTGSKIGNFSVVQKYIEDLLELILLSLD